MIILFSILGIAFLILCFWDCIEDLIHGRDPTKPRPNNSRGTR